ncbi:hypothetical protein INT45_014051 [Circinella minor]|uniref:DDE-1 domain-containing protein n=1 Tax=Circinella minor TaxID=1195481 RepID=A0A8H7S332_9FUNG|nr:hypothetical protein INT45_014051 [Circinella minor]
MGKTKAYFNKLTADQEDPIRKEYATGRARTVKELGQFFKLMYPNLRRKASLSRSIEAPSGKRIPPGMIGQYPSANTTSGRNFAEKLGYPEGTFKASNGWQDRFRKCYGFGLIRNHGESGSANEAAIESAFSSIIEEVSKYRSCDIYNMDETSILYCNPPVTRPIQGMKQDKSGITVALTVHADGSDFREPLIIGKSLNPSCFAASYGFSLYFANKIAWMTSNIFKTYLKRFDRTMVYQQRHVLLLLDNFSGQRCDYTPENIKILYSPPNATTRLQPLDARIIQCFKSHFNNYKYKRVYDETITRSSGELITNCANFLKHQYLLPMKWVRIVWEKNVSAETVQLCFDKPLPSAFSFAVDYPEALEIEEKRQGVVDDEIRGIYDVDFSEAELESFVDPEEERDPIPPPMSNDDIVNLVRMTNESEPNMQETDNGSIIQGLNSIQKAEVIRRVVPFLDEEYYEVEHILRKLRDQYKQKSFTRQSSIEDYFF